MSLRVRIAIGLFTVLAVGNTIVLPAAAFSPDELKKSIDEKAKALQEVNQQIQETQKNLEEAGKKGKSLTKEVKSYDYLISQVNLGIKASQIKIEKYRLEIQGLEGDIEKKEGEVSRMRQGITDLLQELQIKDRESMLITFLKNKSLSEGLFESQSVGRLSEGLTEEMQGLERLKNELSGTLDAVQGKKVSVEGEQRTLKSKKVISEEERIARAVLLSETKNQEKIYQQKLTELEKQQAAIAEEIEGIERELRSKIDPSLLPLMQPGILAWPASSPYMSQGYGATSFALRNYRGQYHNGVDIAGPIGTEIFAAEDGAVTSIGNQDKFCPRGAYGKFIVIRHENGLTTLYAHLSAQSVTPGQKVKRGEVIGYMGRSGWATGPHVHFTVWSTLTHLMKPSKTCGPMPVGGDLDPTKYLGAPTASKVTPPSS